MNMCANMPIKKSDSSSTFLSGVENTPQFAML